MNKFIQEMDNQKFTENGALAYKSTMSANLDLFALGGAYRNRSDEAIEKLVIDAWNSEDQNDTLKILFYHRDILKGSGERRFFRVALKSVLENIESDHNSLKYIISRIPEYGRWDDVIWIGMNTDSEAVSKYCFEVIKAQYYSDLSSDRPSLLGKWMPSENASSPVTRGYSKRMIKYLGISERKYRKSLTSLRKKIGIVESLMSDKLWDSIAYNIVPSQAMLKYRKAFLRHDEGRYNEYLESVKKGDAEIKTTTLYPYQIISRVNPYSYDSSLEVLWQNLPDYTNSRNENALVVCDVSGSMNAQIGDSHVRAIHVSTSLALYFAERYKGEFKGRFITFSSRPDWHVIKGDSLTQKVSNIYNADWGGSTDINAVFELILESAKKANVPEEDMPKVVYIITDMEFDPNSRILTNYEGIQKDYEEAGYLTPNIVFWNVCARKDTVPVKRDASGVTLVSGLSPTIFSYAIEGKTPYEFMRSVLDSGRYEGIHLIG